MGRLTALVLGSAAGGGFPQWNCCCPVCRLAWAGDARVRWRSQASLAVSADGENWVLINASPDLRQQLERAAALHPRAGTRGSPIKAVVLTGAEIDQVAGLLSMRERETFTICATAATLAALGGNAIFDALAPERVPDDITLPLGSPGAITFGLSAVRNVGEGLVELLLAEREENGEYTSFHDFAERVPEPVLNKRTVESLIKAGGDTTKTPWISS